MAAETVRSTGESSFVDRTLCLSRTGNHLVGSVLRGSRTTALPDDVRHLKEVSKNTKSHREPVLGELLTKMGSETVKVLWTPMEDGREEVTDITEHSLTKIVNTKLFM